MAKPGAQVHFNPTAKFILFLVTCLTIGVSSNAGTEPITLVDVLVAYTPAARAGAAAANASVEESCAGEPRHEDTNITLRLHFSDADGTVQRTEIFATPDDDLTQTFLGAVTNADTVVVTNLAAGNYAIFAVAYDDNGASSRSASNLFVSIQPRPPINDNFADAIPLFGTNILVNGRTTSATLEEGEPRWGWSGWHFAEASVWCSWTAPFNGRAQMEVPGFFPVMGAIVGESPSNYVWSVVNTTGGDGLYTRIEFDVLGEQIILFLSQGRKSALRSTFGHGSHQRIMKSCLPASTWNVRSPITPEGKKRMNQIFPRRSGL